MKLEKAMELIQQDIDDPGSVDIMDLHEAQRLGIAALKRINACRLAVDPLADYMMIREDLLLGETKD